MQKLVLCGFYSVGKSTVGKKCATQLNIPFFDTDLLMEKKYQKKPREIWQEVGEQAFRDLEEEIIFDLSQEKKHCIVALGGGALLSEKNCSLIRQMGILIYLKATAETLLQRACKKGFPSFFNDLEGLKRIAAIRFPLYENAAYETIETDFLTSDEVTDLVCDFYGK